jgi:hypothetical protein
MDHNTSWQGGVIPTSTVNGVIVIDADCETQLGSPLNLSNQTFLRINPGKKLKIK